MIKKLVFFSLIILAAFGAEAAPTLLMEDMTWPEIRDAIATGKTTALIPTGGTEQNGPHLALGKHNFILQKTAPAIAAKLGNALVAPILSVVPEGSITPPEGHMVFAGTLGVTPETFAHMLEDEARSLKQHGFKTICLVGEHGASQPVQQQVADKLSKEWAAEHVKVIHVSHYYDEGNGQNAYVASTGEKDPDPQAHGGLADTSEMLAAHPQGVREKLRGNYSATDWQKLGVQGPSTHATKALGAKLIDLKIEAAVKQIQSESAE